MGQKYEIFPVAEVVLDPLHPPLYRYRGGKARLLEYLNKYAS